MFKDKKLYKSSNKKISGVCAGIAEYFGIDPTIVRVIYALVTLFSAGFVGIIVYAVLAFYTIASNFHISGVKNPQIQK